MLRFPDGSRVRVNGLDEILADLYSEGRQPNKETVEEIIDRLEKKNNYISPSARREYKSVLLKEYRDYVNQRKNKAP
jgi:predicted transcriptional regulator